MNEEHEFEIEIEAQPGDLVEVDGYPGYYFVDGYIVQHHVFNNEEYTEVVYELTNAHYGDWLEADVEDLTFVADAGQLAEMFPDEQARYERRVAKYDAFLAKLNN